MPNRMYTESEHVTPWTLVRYLGTGGNSEVWFAQHEDGNFAAVKFSARKPNDQCYLRFKDEINLHQKLGDIPGMLPMRAITYLITLASAISPGCLCRKLPPAGKRLAVRWARQGAIA